MRIKSLLMYAGAAAGSRLVRTIERTSDDLVMGQWMKRRGITPGDAPQRKAVWAAVAQRIAHRPVLYLEFGVFEGEATLWWSEHLTHPASVLHGFDTFEGLPEEWRSDRPKGMFNVQGKIPQIPDPRVRFIKGLFHDTLPTYAMPDHDLLLINIDVDLYSSTKYVLDFLRPHLKPGTLIYFDEFSSRQHEFRAFDEFLNATGFTVNLIASDPVLYAVAFEFQ